MYVQENVHTGTIMLYLIFQQLMRVSQQFSFRFSNLLYEVCTRDRFLVVTSQETKKQTEIEL